MSQQQGRITDSLASVVQFIQAEHKTGELRVQRDEGRGLEQGTIIFMDGRIVYAQTGPYQETRALEVLQTWGRCIFLFSQHPTMNNNETHLPASPSQTSPVQHSPAQGPRDVQPFGPFPSAQRTPPTPAHYSRPSETHPNLAMPLTVIPRATMSVIKAIKLIEKEGLPRTYRQIFLLIDGQQNVNDLLRLTNGTVTPEEVVTILRTLENLTVIILTN